MRVIISAAYGTWGDLAPLLQLAQELRNDHQERAQVPRRCLVWRSTRDDAALQVAMVVDAFFYAKVASNDGIRVLALGSAEAYAAALSDPEARWRKPVTLVHAWLDRLKEHYEVCASTCVAQQPLMHRTQLLARLLAEAPKETVIVGHSLDLAVKLIEARLRLSSQRAVALPHSRTPRRRRRSGRGAPPWCCSRGCSAPKQVQPASTAGCRARQVTRAGSRVRASRSRTR